MTGQRWSKALAFGALGLMIVAVTAVGAADAPDLKGDVAKLAGLIEKKDADVPKLAAALGKNVDAETLMGLFGVRKPDGKEGGLGVGKAPGAIKPDGIDKKLADLKKQPITAKDLAEQAEALKDLGYHSAAIGAVNGASAVPDKQKARKADWVAWSKDLQDSGVAFAEAVASKDPAVVTKAATKLNASCVRCHEVFRE